MLSGVGEGQAGAAGGGGDAAIYEVYLVGRERNYLRSSQVFRDVYRHIAAELGFPSDEAHAEGISTAVLQWPAFPD